MAGSIKILIPCEPTCRFAGSWVSNLPPRHPPICTVENHAHPSIFFDFDGQIFIKDQRLRFEVRVETQIFNLESSRSKSFSTAVTVANKWMKMKRGGSV